MKRTLYILLGFFSLTACQQQTLLDQAECVLELSVSRVDAPMVATRSVDSDLAITILDDKGKEYLHYPAGEAPGKIVLKPGLFTVRAYTDNQNTWHTANGGKGAGCYYATQLVQMEADRATRLTMDIPMTNYAVGVELPELFDEMFASYQLTLKSGNREVGIQEGERAYFSLADGGFTHALSVTNTDGVTHSYAPRTFTDVQSGKCFLLSYSYGFEDVPIAKVNIQ